MLAVIALFKEDRTLGDLDRIHGGAQGDRGSFIKGGKERGSTYDFVFVWHIGSLLVWPLIAKLAKALRLSIGY